MTSTFVGFSEEDLQRIKSGEPKVANAIVNDGNAKKISKIGAKPKKVLSNYNLSQTDNMSLGDSIDDMDFAKCKLSFKPESTDALNNNNKDESVLEKINLSSAENLNFSRKQSPVEEIENLSVLNSRSRKSSCAATPEICQSIADNYTENELALHKVKLEELQLRQKIMEEQNKKRKEMLAKALADRTKQTVEETLKLEKIKRELQVLDGQLSQDVAVLRKKIDQACLAYADAEKHYLKVENEFLQAKLQLQKQKEHKELLTEHLCALITHNETRKAKKLEILMRQLTSDGIIEDDISISDSTDAPVIVDGVDERTGKIVEMDPDN